MILLFAAALANPEAGLHATLGVGTDGEQPTVMLGGGAHLAVALVPRLHLEARVNAGPSLPDAALWAGGAAGLRAFFAAPSGLAPSVFAGGGAAWSGAVQPLAQGGLALDTGRSPGPRMRVELAGAFSPDGAVRGLLSAGGVFGRKGGTPAPPTERAPEAEPDAPAAPEADTLPPVGMVWLPGPVCAWLPPGPAQDELDRLGMQLASLNIVGPREPDRALAPGESAARAPTPGRLLVPASPADRVRVGGVEAPVRDGLATAAHPEGPVQVQILGGGRLIERTVALVEDHAVWLTVEPPSALRVDFSSGSAAPDAQALDQLARLAELAGGWSFQIVGSASPDGDPDRNQQLAVQRAEAVRDALLAQGLPADRVELGPTTAPDPALPLTQQRNALVMPVESR